MLAPYRFRRHQPEFCFLAEYLKTICSSMTSTNMCLNTLFPMNSTHSLAIATLILIKAFTTAESLT